MKVEQHRVRLARCIYTGHAENQNDLRRLPQWADLPLSRKKGDATLSKSHWLFVADFVIGWQDLYN